MAPYFPPAFMRTAPPMVAGIPINGSSPAKPAATVSRMVLPRSRPPPTRAAVTGPLALSCSPLKQGASKRTTTPSTPSSVTKRFAPSPRMRTRTALREQRRSRVASASGVFGRTRASAEPPMPYQVCCASGASSSTSTSRSAKSVVLPSGSVAMVITRARWRGQERRGRSSKPVRRP